MNTEANTNCFNKSLHSIHIRLRLMDIQGYKVRKRERERKKQLNRIAFMAIQTEKEREIETKNELFF